VSSIRIPPITRLQRIAIWLTLLNSWILFEEIVVDRTSLWQYMPLYRVARFCSWDVAAIVSISVIVWKQFRVPRAEGAKGGGT
jgi:hypothetical protein